MASPITLTLLTLVLLWALKIGRQFARNLAAAKASGIPYTISPFYPNNRFYQLCSLFLVPLIRLLPKTWTEPWFELSTMEWGWERRYEPFKTFGTDTFIVVSPERIVLSTADPDVISQITTRRNDFPKALEVYGSLRIYGNNIVTSEGQLWRHHRKIVSPPFSEKNNSLVWSETLSQTEEMVRYWQENCKIITTLADDTMRLSLHIISRTVFGVALQWPNKTEAALNGPVKDGKEGASSATIGKGHDMSYRDALGSILHNVITLLIVPRFLLKRLPSQHMKTTYKAYIEWGKYMQDLFATKKRAILAGEESSSTIDLMTAMLKGAGITRENALKSPTQTPTQTLTDAEILGNAFVFILAGHETTANSIHFVLVLLAINLASQRRLQRSLDSIFGARPPNTWDYDTDAPKLFNGMAGAVMNEELRLIPPIVGLPKCTPKHTPQPLDVAGKPCIVPAHTYIQFMTPAVHRNPHHWPTAPPNDPAHPIHPLSNIDNDLEEFKPERWLLDPSDPATTTSSPSSPLPIDAPTSPSLYTPKKGAYIPFSDGHRSCIGRRFAQVEILAAIAYIFKTYSVELAVDEFASDENVAQMEENGKRKVWEKAKAEVERKMVRDMGSIITLQLRKGVIPIRLVRRGEERFDFKD